MTEEARKARREYMRKWYQDNKDKQAAYNAKYWEKKAQAAERGQTNNDSGDIEPRRK